jgi:AraC-like DNA-binding protein
VFILIVSAFISFSMAGFYLTLAGIPFIGLIRRLYTSSTALIIFSCLFACLASTPVEAVFILNIILTVIVSVFLFINFIILNVILIVRLRRTDDAIMKKLIKVIAVYSLSIFILFGWWFVLDVFFSFDATGGHPSIYEIMFLAWNLVAVVLFILYVIRGMEDGAASRIREPSKSGISTLSCTFAKYEKSNLERSQAEAHLSKLLHIMKTAHPYHDPDLTLDRLAKLCGISRNVLSQVLNQYRKTSFFDFISEYRVRDAKRLLSDPDCRMSILEIAFEAGFNSKTAFYTAFKKMEDVNPSEFRTRALGRAPAAAAQRPSP